MAQDRKYWRAVVSTVMNLSASTRRLWRVERMVERRPCCLIGLVGSPTFLNEILAMTANRLFKVVITCVGPRERGNEPFAFRTAITNL